MALLRTGQILRMPAEARKMGFAKGPLGGGSADLFQLAFRVLVEAADADVTDPLTVQGTLRGTIRQE
jgi:hypothetical protein